MGGTVQFKVATEESEFDQIHRLNYRTFVEEIPQHAPDPKGVRVDRFHGENTYLVGMDGKRVVAMVAVRSRRPFSLDEKLPDLDSHLPPGRTVCEFRLLSIEPEFRNGIVFRGLMEATAELCRNRGYDLGILSGTTRQTKLYRHMGFTPFGPLVGTVEAPFQPMYMTLEAFRATGAAIIDEGGLEGPRRYFLPGPVAIADAVREAFEKPPISTRSGDFVRDFQRLRRLLCEMTRSPHVQVLMGSGTLANDAVAARLSVEGGRGLVLANGEFGERLVDQASRARLDFEPFRAGWGDVLDIEALEKALSGASRPDWIWAVHCESSTGILNDMGTLKRICGANAVRLCMDCVSSLGTVPVDLAGVHMATSVSGKALAAYPGLAMVFHRDEIPTAPGRLPRYLDLGYYAEHEGIAFTLSSNLVHALLAAMEHFSGEDRFAELAEITTWLRGRLTDLGLPILAPEAVASPSIVTLPLPRTVSSEHVGLRLEEEGHLLSYRSGYLLSRNWLQICIMGQVDRGDLEVLLPRLALLVHG
jgi:aspartate aminotransferase-like enzyme